MAGSRRPARPADALSVQKRVPPEGIPGRSTGPILPIISDYGARRQVIRPYRSPAVLSDLNALARRHMREQADRPDGDD